MISERAQKAISILVSMRAARREPNKVYCPKCGSDSNKIVNTRKRGAPRFRYKCLNPKCPKLFD